MANIYESGTLEAAQALLGSDCAFGVFDGVHRGHAFLINAALGSAAPQSTVLTFDIDPDELFYPDRHRKIMTNDRRIETLAACGVDSVVILPFTRDFARLSPSAFLAETFGDAVPASVHVGSDIRFGSRASGTVATLGEWGAASGCAVVVHDLLVVDGAPVTSSRIRGLLSQGSIEEANDLLGHSYVVEGTVVEGRHEGRDMGFRTANLALPTNLRTLGEGVYAAYAYVDGRRYKAAVSMGVAPTFADEATATCEAHLLDFDSSIYGQRIELEFRRWLRPMKAFDSVEELVRTVMGNIQWVRDNL